MRDFVKISRYAGMREDLVQAGGGNSAFKIASDKMAIKASGTQLADMTMEDGYALVNPAIVKEAFLTCDDLNDMIEEDSKKILADSFIGGKRPSIETFLHSISGRYSLHTHPMVVNALTCRENGAEILIDLFPDALIVPYATPGIELAKAYFKAYKEYKKIHDKDPVIVFLMNHGLLVSSDTGDEVIEKTEEVTQRIESYLKVDMSGYHMMTELLDFYDEGIIWKVTDVNVIESYKKIGKAWEHYFCPDCVVFLGKKIYEVSGDRIERDDYDAFVAENGYPVVWFYKNNIYIHADSVKKALEIQSVLSFSGQVMVVNNEEKCNLLPEKEKNFLLNWDAERYRRNMK